MPYASNTELPSGVRRHLPGPAQDIYQVFKHAWVTHADDVRQEEIAHRVAWSAVKKKYQKVGDEWVLMTSAALHGRDLGA